jgi:hypothetical protein
MKERTDVKSCTYPQVVPETHRMNSLAGPTRMTTDLYKIKKLCGRDEMAKMSW